MLGSSSAIRILWVMAVSCVWSSLRARHGSSKPKHAPWPGSERSHIRPPKCSTIWRLIGRPRPVPCGRFGASPPWRNFSNTSCLLRRRHAGAVVLHLDGGVPVVGAQAHARPGRPRPARTWRRWTAGSAAPAAAGRGRRAASAPRPAGPARPARRARGTARRWSAPPASAARAGRRRRCATRRGRTRSWPCRAPG